jgi:hypothetical protein
MNAKNKELAKKMILSMKPDHLTYLWSGMRLALNQFSGDPDMTAALMILTDGRPNERLSNGVVAAMRRWCKDKQFDRMPVPIHTFGFGYNLQEGLLHSIAEFGGGDYCFIPDASMLGTSFNHTIANLQSIYAQKATLTLTYPDVLRLTELGIYINKAEPVEASRGRSGTYMEYSIDLRTIQYGQSRDFFLQFGWRPDARTQASKNPHWWPHVRATLKYGQRQENMCAFTESDLSIDGIMLSPAESAFHISRAMTVEFLSRLFPLSERGDHQPLLKCRVPTYDDLQRFLARLPANKFRNDPLNVGLIEDFIGTDNKKGEVELGLQTAAESIKCKSSWEKWGRHYLPSLLMAHQFQKCLSFKDPGTQGYGKGSKPFRDQLDVIDYLFDSLPAPPPSRPPAPPPYDTAASGPIAPLLQPPKMSRYRNVSSTCFAGHTRVLVVDPTDGTEKAIPIEKLRHGDVVKTLKSKTRAVETVLKCHTDQTKGRTMTVIPVNDTTSLWVTPWHPISLDGGSTWVRPAEEFPEDKYPEMVKAGFMEPVYAVQLERQADHVDDVADDHAINVEGLWGATMGHGLTSKNATGKVDVRIHDFYGDWDAVDKSLKKLPKHDGLRLGDGTTTDERTGLSNGFLPFEGVRSRL